MTPGIPAGMLPGELVLNRPHLPEAERRARRRDLRKQIAAREITEQRYRELVESLARLNAELDTAAAEHVERCRPIQERLQAIETERVDDYADGKVKNEKIERERLKLVEQLDQANTELALAVERLNAKKSVVTREQHNITLKSAGEPSVAVLQGQIIREAANPSLADELFVCGVEKWFRSRQVETLSKLCNAYQREGGEEAARKLGLVLSQASAALGELTDEAAELRQKIINE